MFMAIPRMSRWLVAVGAAFLVTIAVAAQQVRQAATLPLEDDDRRPRFGSVEELDQPHGEQRKHERGDDADRGVAPVIRPPGLPRGRGRLEQLLGRARQQPCVDRTDRSAQRGTRKRLHDVAQQLLDFRLALNFTCAHNVRISKVSAVRIVMTLGSARGGRDVRMSRFVL